MSSSQLAQSRSSICVTTAAAKMEGQLEGLHHACQVNRHRDKTGNGDFALRRKRRPTAENPYVDEAMLGEEGDQEKSRKCPQRKPLLQALDHNSQCG